MTVRVKVLRIDQQRGRAWLQYAEGPAKGSRFSVFWDPAEGEQNMATGDVVELRRLPE